MDAFQINGGKPLRGTVRINGSKNASLPLMAASLLTTEPVTLHGVPGLSDIRAMQELLASLGMAFSGSDADAGRSETLGTPAPIPPAPPVAEKIDPKYSGLSELIKPKSTATATITPQAGAERRAAPGHAASLTIATEDNTPTLAHYEIVRKMRAGICVLGPLLAARGEARVSLPGGCAIGDRPVDLHIRGLRALGAEISIDGGYIVARPPAGGRLIGTTLFLGGPNGSTVLGTANVLSAAVLAEGDTVIESAACEPEITDLCALLTKMGAKISGAGTPRITVEGVAKLHGTEHHVLADRIEAGTYVMAAAITGGDVILENFPTDTLLAAIDRLEEMGITLEQLGDNTNPGLSDTVRVITPRIFQPVQVVTQPHPGFPTDLQAQLMALLTLSDGNSIVTEKIFPDRFLHVAELLRMGANITRVGNSAVITGVRNLVGAPVMASDLRASAGLVIAGLAARGQTTINRVYHLDRGYQQMEKTLQALGADIERVKMS
ncbi:MAG: UDP-N-acetylglucosamine 1-carboxyvinyltransferase [Phycisphaeraceae bacterium]|nr:UDP-N-acetylglucosamine 1-carboxyvinyltransferase [Phycisphaeraceae bacterium]